MSTFQSQLRVFTGFVRSCAAGTHTQGRPTHGASRLPWRRVLIVEFRDEVFASLKALFEDFGVRVDRVEHEAEVSRSVSRSRPDLVLISGSMPEESAWLISAKIHMQLPECKTWLYMPRVPHGSTHWQKFAESAAVIEDGGVMSTLLDKLRCRLRRSAESESSRVNLSVVWPEQTVAAVPA